MAKSNRKKFVYYFFVTNLWLCPVVQAQHVHKTESLRDRMLQQRERYRHAPPDYGFGENVAPPADLIWNHQQPGGPPAAASGATAVPPSTAAVAADAAAVPKGGIDAATHGLFGPVLPWPFIPIHMGLLPDGRVMNYGRPIHRRTKSIMTYGIRGEVGVVTRISFCQTKRKRTYFAVALVCYRMEGFCSPAATPRSAIARTLESIM